MANLTGKQLVEQGIITGLINEENIQQHGTDLNLMKVQQIIGKGFIPREGKTQLAERVDILPIQIEGSDKWIWDLTPGSYDITFLQGCKVPEDKMLLIRQRSSLLRNGTLLHSSCFDAGYECSQIGTVMHVRAPTSITIGTLTCITVPI